ncbi:MAG: outer membrane beta-barrel protein, partial [Balneolaceae bacterium]
MIKLISFSIILWFTSVSVPLLAQNSEVENNLWDRTTFRIATDFFSEQAQPSSDWNSSKSFYSNPLLSIEMDYAFTKNFTLNAGLSYTGSSTEANGILDYAIQPEDDATHTIKSEDKFRNLMLDPKAKLIFSLRQFDFFWSAGPIVSFAVLNSESSASTYANPKSFNTLNSNNSKSIGFGAQASTGFQYFLTNNFGLSLEIGYKTLSHKSLYTQIDFTDQKQSADYTLNTMFQRVGVVFKF